MRLITKLTLITSFFLLSACSMNHTAPMFASGGVSDTALTTSVRDAFMQNGEPQLSVVHIQTSEGKVMLSGYVKKIRQSDLAEHLARQVPGVQSVENNIIVRQ